MHTYLMFLTTVLETGVVDEIGAPVLSGDDGVMTLRAFAKVAFGHVAPLAVGSEDVHTPVIVGAGAEVGQETLEHRIGVAGIDVGTVWLL